MPTPDESRAALLAAARQLLGLADDDSPLAVVLVPGRALVVSGRDAPAPPDPSQLPPLQAAIYAALAGGPRSSHALARLVRRRWNSYFRGVLSRMVRAGLLRRVAAGYARQEDTRSADSQADTNS